MHLFDSGGTATTTDDLVLADLASIVDVLKRSSDNVFIEEKVDGANLGFSICPFSGEIRAQNRSHFISKGDHAQFNRVSEWIAEHQEALRSILQGGNRILYGEWVVARHSIPYGKMPGLFVAFDLYDAQAEGFLSRERFHTVMKGSEIPIVPILQRGLQTFQACQRDSKHQVTHLLRKELLALLEAESKFRSDGGNLVRGT